MKIEMNEQDLVDAVCVFAADRHRRNISEIRAELLFDDQNGVEAEASWNGQSARFTEREVIDSVAMFLADYHHFDAGRLTVEVGFDDGRGVFAEAVVQ